MLLLKEEACIICQSSNLKDKKINKDWLHVNGKTFELRDIHGLICSDCEEVYVRHSAKDMFENLLKQGLYEPLEKKEIGVYDFKEFKTTPESFKDLESSIESCIFCNSWLDEGLHTIPYRYDNEFIYIQNVYIKLCGNCYEGSFFPKKLKLTLDEFCKQVKKGEIKPVDKTEYITLKCQ